MDDFLTERQKQILDFVCEFHQRRGIAPTHLEIRRRFGYRSYGTVHKHLKLLRQKGYLRGGWNQKRGLELTEKTLRGRRPAANAVPFHGRVAAGRPIEAVPGVDDLPVPEHLLEHGPAGRHYVLEVEGDSMIDDGICDGDLVVIAERHRARSGQVIVALIDDEATLKRYFPEGDSIRLQPANREMEPLYVAADRLRIQGIVVGLMRRY
ncbi:MAG: transcriptional repressor LexA [Acidobacteria bacterium]|nr:transcriptional repressor LexA [Acidobacteriota bacterium]